MIFRNRFMAGGIFLILLAASALTGCIYTHAPKPPNYTQVRTAFFSPDGKSIYFTLQDNKLFGLFRMDLNGKVGSWLFRGWPYDPAVSPDGQTLAFALANKKQEGDLFTMDADGSDLHWLTSGPNHDRSPRFSHDGKRIFFLRHDSWGSYPRIDLAEGWDSDIFSVETATGKIRRITDDKFYHLWAFALFPDDRLALIFKNEHLTTGVSLWKISLDDPKRRWSIEPTMRPSASNQAAKLHEGQIPPAKNCAVLSRDGRYLVFAWQAHRHQRLQQEVGQQIFLCRMEDMGTRLILEHKHCALPLDISPDNQWIIFAGSPARSKFRNGVLTNGNLWMVRRDGSGLTNLELDFRKVLDKPPTALRLP